MVIALLGCREVRVTDDGSGGTSSLVSSSSSQTDPVSVTASASSSSTGIAVTGDVFDPDEVYLAGTLEPLTCDRYVIAHPAAPNDAVAGFDCQFDGSTAAIRPTDGRLIYGSAKESVVREFRCDNCPYAGEYPAAPLANDVAVATEPCGTPFVHFLVSPTGRVLHHCEAESPWYDEQGVAVFSDPEESLLHLGYDDLAFTTKGNLVDLATSVVTPSQGVPPGNYVMAVRALPSGDFSLVSLPNGRAADHKQRDLWALGRSGVVTWLGTFPALPDEIEPIGQSGQLDGSSAFVEIGKRFGTGESVIVRRVIGGSTEIVYDGADQPLVKIGASLLITGP